MSLEISIKPRHGGRPLLVFRDPQLDRTLELTVGQLHALGRRQLGRENLARSEAALGIQSPSISRRLTRAAQRNRAVIGQVIGFKAYDKLGEIAEEMGIFDSDTLNNVKEEILRYRQEVLICSKTHRSRNQRINLQR